MKYRYTVIAFALLLIFSSCNFKKDKGLLISGQHSKLWKIIKGAPSNSKATYYYFFMNDGGFKIYEKYYQSNKIVEYIGSDVYYIRNWKLKNDSLINIAGMDYTLLKASDDTIIIYNNTFKNVEMIKSNEQVIH